MTNHKQKGEGHAHAKIILFGEHTVVHGQPAIAFPMKQIGLHATATSRPGDLCLDVDIYSGPLADAPSRLSPLVTVIEATLDLMEHPLSGVRVECDGDIPMERGLGSSAAGATAIVNALTDYTGHQLDDHRRYELVQAGERVAHGSPSGLDASSVVAARPIWFQAGSMEPLEVNLSCPFVVADTGQVGETHSAVNAVSDLRRANPAMAARYFEIIRRHTVGARDDLVNDDAVSLGNRMSEVHQTLQALSVSSVELDHLVAAAGEAGALGAKLTGGGRGGCMIALARDMDHAAQLSDALQSAGAPRTWTISPEEFQQ